VRRLIAVAVLLVACGILPAHAQTISLAFKQGEQFKYTLHFTGTFTAHVGSMSQDVKIDAKAKETVTTTAVESDGTADMTLTLSDLTITTTGKSADGSTTTSTTTQTNAIPPQQLRVAPDGRILSINGESISSTSPFGVLAGSYLVYAVLPDSAVKPGDKWSKSYDQAQPGGSSSVHVTSNSTYLRDESLRGVNAAVVETKSTADFMMNLFSPQSPPPNTPNGTRAGPTPAGLGAMQGSVSSDTTSWIDPGAHRVLKSSMKAKLKATVSEFENQVTVTGTQSVDLEPA
jgi:cytoskeletal protein CcmA (bactofilin family)